MSLADELRAKFGQTDAEPSPVDKAIGLVSDCDTLPRLRQLAAALPDQLDLRDDGEFTRYVLAVRDREETLTRAEADEALNPRRVSTPGERAEAERAASYDRILDEGFSPLWDAVSGQYVRGERIASEGSE